MTAQELAYERRTVKVPETARTASSDTRHDKYGCQVEKNHHVTADRYENVFPY